MGGALSNEERLRLDVGHVIEARRDLLQQESRWNGEVSIESAYSVFSRVARYDGTSPTVLDAIGITVSEAALRQREVDHPYNRYIFLLESLQRILALPPDTFYRRLLRIQLAERSAHIRAWGDGLAPSDVGDYQAAWLKAAVGLSR